MNRWHILTVIATALVAVLDLCTPLGIAGGVPYIVAVLLAHLTKQRGAMIATGVTCLCLTWGVYLLSLSGAALASPHWYVLINRGYASGALLAVTVQGLFLLHLHEQVIGRVRDGVEVLRETERAEPFDDALDAIEVAVTLLERRAA